MKKLNKRETKAVLEAVRITMLWRKNKIQEIEEGMGSYLTEKDEEIAYKATIKEIEILKKAYIKLQKEVM